MAGPLKLKLDVLESDHVNDRMSDDKCSRCRQPIPEDEVPLMLWDKHTDRMWAYCQICTPKVLVPL